MAKQSSGITHNVEEQAIVKGTAINPAIKSLAARLHKQKFVLVLKQSLSTTKNMTVKLAAMMNRANSTRPARVMIAEIGRELEFSQISFVASAISSGAIL